MTICIECIALDTDRYIVRTIHIAWLGKNKKIYWSINTYYSHRHEIYWSGNIYCSLKGVLQYRVTYRIVQGVKIYRITCHVLHSVFFVWNDNYSHPSIRLLSHIVSLLSTRDLTLAPTKRKQQQLQTSSPSPTSAVLSRSSVILGVLGSFFHHERFA